MRAVIYARYSSENQREASLEDQVRDCRALIDRQGWTYQHAYTDRALSGASTLRPGYQLLLQEAREGRFDVVVAEALDRLSRDQEHVAALYKRLRFAGVGLVTLGEGEITDLHVGLKGTMNALFLKDLADKTRRGLRGRVEAGRSGGGNAYGYDVVHEPGPDGLPVRGVRRIDPGEAAVVRRIFAAYAAGRSARRIAHNLNAEAVPAPGGRSWGASTISGNAARGTGVLNNELYVGRLVWNKLRYIKDPETGRRVSRLNEPGRWVVKEVPESRIVDQDLWDRVKARQATMRCDTRPDVRIRPCDRRRPRYLLSGLIVCGVCGARYTKLSADLFGCAAARNKGAAVCSNLRNVRRDRLEAMVLDALRHHLMDPERVEEFIAFFHEEVNRTRRDEGAARAGKERELAEVKRKLAGLIDAIAEGIRAPGLQQRLDETRKAALEQALAADPPPPVRLHPNLAQVYRQKVERLHVALADPMLRDEALSIVRGLIERVVLHAAEDGLQVEIVGEIVRMVELGLDSKKAALPKEAACSVKVVAGVGFEPTTFRL